MGKYNAETATRREMVLAAFVFLDVVKKRLPTPFFSPRDGSVRDRRGLQQQGVDGVA